MKRQHAEDLKREEAEICRLGKLHKAAQKEKDKAGKVRVLSLCPPNCARSPVSAVLTAFLAGIAGI